MSLKEKQEVWQARSKLGSNNSEIKRQNSTMRGKDPCLVTGKLMRQITGTNPTATLERKDEHKHLHSLEARFMVKRSKQVQELINRETEKNYSAAQVYHAIRKCRNRSW